jgi:transcriptional regulator with XRE-family HTH domain
MTARNLLLSAPPYEVDQALKAFGANLRTARLRRNLSLAEMARKIGVGREVVAAAEHGKPSTSIATYAALLWALGLTGQMARLADPATDLEGQQLARHRERGSRAVQPLSDDF